MGQADRIALEGEKERERERLEIQNKRLHSILTYKDSPPIHILVSTACKEKFVNKEGILNSL